MDEENKTSHPPDDEFESGSMLMTRSDGPRSVRENNDHDPAELRSARKAAQKKRAGKKNKRARRDKRQAEKDPGMFKSFALNHRGLLVVLCVVLACLILVLALLAPTLFAGGPASSQSLWMPSFSLPPPASSTSEATGSNLPQSLWQPPEEDPGVQLAFTEDELTVLNTFLDEWAAKETFINVQEKDDAGEFKGDPIWEADGGHQVSAWFMDIDSGLSYEYNAEASYVYASLMKAPYAQYLYLLVEQGNASIAETFTITEDSIGKYKENSGKIKDMPLPREFTLREMIYYLIRYSDTLALKVLLERYPAAGFLEWAGQLGLEHPETLGTVMQGSITARDAGVFINVLYHYMDSGHFGNELRDDMENATNRLIVSPQYPTAHKYGWDDHTYHDMAAVFAPHPYVLVILTDKWGGGDDDRAGFRQFAALIEPIMEAKWAAV